MQPETRKELKAPTSAEAQAKLDGKREVELQANIAALLTQRNICFFWQRTDKRTRGRVGWPDLIFSINGRAIAFEVKTLTGNLSAEQDACHAAMRHNGWAIYVVRGEQSAVAILNQLEGSTNGTKGNE